MPLRAAGAAMVGVLVAETWGRCGGVRRAAGGSLWRRTEVRWPPAGGAGLGFRLRWLRLRVRLWLLLLRPRRLLPARLSAGVLTSAGIAAATAPASPVDRSWTRRLKLPRYDVERGQRRSERYRSRRSLGRTNARHWDIPARSAPAPTRYSGGSVMPFVRIDLMRGKSIEYRKTIGEIIYNAMRDVIDVPKDDKFQVITEHPAEAFNVSER